MSEGAVLRSTPPARCPEELVATPLPRRASMSHYNIRAILVFYHFVFGCLTRLDSERLSIK
jgi:hypothetical protein